MIEPLVSIIVTCYNHEDYIKECLNSIYKQNYSNIELLILNDGSTDSSINQINQSIVNSPFQRTYLYSHSNQGVVYTRNKGIELAKGDYLLFVDSDDALPYNYISSLVSSAIENASDIVYCGMKNIETEDLVLEARPFSLEQLLLGNYIQVSALINKSIVKECRFDNNLDQIEDYDFFLQLIIKEKAKASPNNDVFLRYRILETSRSSRGDQASFYRAYTYILLKYKKDLPYYVEKAESIHFKRNFALDRALHQKVTIYLSIDNKGFNQKDVLEFRFKSDNQISFSVPNNTTALRVDISELPSYFKKVSLLDNDFQTELIPTCLNGKVVQNHVLFADPDPQLYYDISGITSTDFTLRYQMFDEDDLFASDYVAKQLSKELADTYDQLMHYSPYKAMYFQSEKIREAYKSQLEEMVDRYNSVTHSRRWIIPTKIINIFRRKK
ncbi:glycosyltransferase, group 2 family protein [Streptococcus urinalis 2285-97]|uniref:Glycosyltransferase, group 2 family protein n=2 Tax=Streptococcus urinalis TaxID=149016 RepID=G5KHB8_9STRE|nr:glycosyltransferase, group 2 family protein [Streptococcus urinalis 2285-97]